MQDQTLLRENNGQSPLCSGPKHMFMNDKQSKLVRSSTAQSKDLPEQMLNRRSLTTSVDNCPSTSIAGTYTYCIGDQSQFNQFATGHHLSRLNASAIGAIRLLQD